MFFTDFKVGEKFKSRLQAIGGDYHDSYRVLLLQDRSKAQEFAEALTHVREYFSKQWRVADHIYFYHLRNVNIIHQYMESDGVDSREELEAEESEDRKEVGRLILDIQYLLGGCGILIKIIRGRHQRGDEHHFTYSLGQLYSSLDTIDHDSQQYMEIMKREIPIYNEVARDSKRKAERLLAHVAQYEEARDTLQHMEDELKKL
ncbi:MAG: hypothetical protein ABH879_11030 [archaeon]